MNLKSFEIPSLSLLQLFLAIILQTIQLFLLSSVIEYIFRIVVYIDSINIFVIVIVMQYYPEEGIRKKNQNNQNNLSCFMQFHSKNKKNNQNDKLQNVSTLINQYRNMHSRKFNRQSLDPQEEKSSQNVNDSYYSTINDGYKYIHNDKKKEDKSIQENQNKLQRVLSTQFLNTSNQFKLSKNASTSSLFQNGNGPQLKKNRLIQKLEIHKNSLNSIQEKLNKFGIEIGQKTQAKASQPVNEKTFLKQKMQYKKIRFNHYESQSNLLLNNIKEPRPLTSLKEKQYTLKQVHQPSPLKQELKASITSGGSHHSKYFKMNIQNLIGQKVDSGDIQEAFKKPRSFGNQKKSPILKDKQLDKQLKNISPKSVGSMNSGQNWFKKIDRTLKETISTDYSSISVQLSINDFALGKLIGKGKFGTVFICRHKKTGFVCALKIIKKDTIRKERSLEQLTRQIKIQSFLNHCNNVKMYAFFDDKQNIYLLLQYCIEGHLYSILKQKKKFSEEEAVFILKDICQGIKELHEKHIIHRDIKPQNIVMCCKMAKLCDYGWSVNCQNEKRQTFCGTPLYVSPQLLTGKTYDYKVDIWALGIMSYELLTGRLPFQITTQKQLRKIVTHQIKYPSYLSPKAISLMKHLLQKDPNYRNDIHSILKHDFFIQGLTKRQNTQHEKE